MCLHYHLRLPCTNTMIKADIRDCTFLSDDLILKSAEDDAWRLTAGWAEGTPSHTYQWHWSLSRTAEMAICTSFFFFYCGKKKCAMFQHQVVSGLFWWAGRYLGWVGHFCVLQLLKWQQTGLGTRVKLLYSAMWQWSGKKDPSPLPGPSPKDPRVQCSTRPWITMHHRPRSRGLLGSKHCELYSNILSHFHVHVCEQAVNISSHCIIHLMQYLIHVHGITNVCLFLLHTIKFIVICKKNKQVI